MKYFVCCNQCERTIPMLKSLTCQEVYWCCW